MNIPLSLREARMVRQATALLRDTVGTLDRPDGTYVVESLTDVIVRLDVAIEADETLGRVVVNDRGESVTLGEVVAEGLRIAPPIEE